MYYSQGYIEEFCARMTSAVQKITDSYEIVLVDDGSPDKSFETAKNLAMKDDRIKVIQLSRNFGAAVARWEGMQQSKGDLVFILDADLEERPELLLEFYDRINNEEEIDVVFGYQEVRRGGLLSKWTGKLYYKAFKVLSGIEIVGSPVWARLMTRNYVSALLMHKEFHLFALGIMKIVGFVQVGVPIEKKIKGYTSYSLRRKLSQMLDSFISFSDKPMRLISSFGLLIALLSFLFIIYIVITYTFFEGYQVGWASLIASIFLVGGLNFSAIGFIGLYIGKNYQQSKNRPRVIVRRMINIE